MDPLLNAIASNLNADQLGEMIEIIHEYISLECTVVSNTEAYNNQIAFALKSDINGVLDLARKTYVTTLEEIHNLYRDYSGLFVKNLLQEKNISVASLQFEDDSFQDEEVTGSSIKEKKGKKKKTSSAPVSVHLKYTSTRGYHLLLVGFTCGIPSICCQAVQTKRGIVCTTEDLLSLNKTLVEYLHEVFTITYEVIEKDLVEPLRNSIEVLFKVTESIALLDMLLSFANVACLNQLYVCPRMNENGYSVNTFIYLYNRIVLPFTTPILSAL